MMRVVVWMCVLLWSAGALAQDIDYGLLMAQNAARVQTPSPGVEMLELPGPVIVTCETGRCTGVDHSAHGAAGCALRVVTQLVVLNAICPDVLPAANKARLARYFDTGWQFWGANTVPVQTSQDIIAVRTKTLQAVAQSLGGQCPIDGSPHGEDLRALMTSATRDTIAGRFAKVFQTPRLPVTNPCL